MELTMDVDDAILAADRADFGDWGVPSGPGWRVRQHMPPRSFLSLAAFPAVSINWKAVEARATDSAMAHSSIGGVVGLSGEI
jgi:hypothetical protein